MSDFVRIGLIVGIVIALVIGLYFVYSFMDNFAQLNYLCSITLGVEGDFFSLLLGQPRCLVEQRVNSNEVFCKNLNGVFDASTGKCSVVPISVNDKYSVYSDFSLSVSIGFASNNLEAKKLCDDYYSFSGVYGDYVAYFLATPSPLFYCVQGV